MSTFSTVSACQHSRISVESFFASYAARFSTHDAAAVAEHFTYPVQAVGVTGEDPGIATAGREEWTRVLDRLLGAYRELGVIAAQPRIIEVISLGRGVRVASMGWTLLHSDKSPVYDFEACYTLVMSKDKTQVAAIAHNEQPKMRAALAHRRRKG